MVEDCESRSSVESASPFGGLASETCCGGNCVPGISGSFSCLLGGGLGSTSASQWPAERFSGEWDRPPLRPWAEPSVLSSQKPEAEESSTLPPLHLLTEKSSQRWAMALQVCIPYYPILGESRFLPCHDWMERGAITSPVADSGLGGAHKTGSGRKVNCSPSNTSGW